MGNDMAMSKAKAAQVKRTHDASKDFTQKVSLHLNGGSEFSMLAYDVFYKGRTTNITRSTKTNGSPNYRKVSDMFICGDDEFDVLARGKKGLLEWLKAHANKSKAKPSRESETK